MEFTKFRYRKGKLITMKKLISIGEALIDFIPSKTGCALKEVPSFKRVCGGAPTNVAAVFAKLGGKAKIITQLGNDAFGDYIVDTVNSVGVDTSSIQRTDKANTALAFVSLKDDGNRDFSFYRKPSADMLLDEKQIEATWFENCGVLHFCSVDLIDAPVKQAHIKAIEYAKNNGALISFDPNIRLPLWDSATDCQRTVREFLKYADIVKISDEELEFITGKTDIFGASQELFENGVKIIIYSMGKDGAMAITPRHGVKVQNCDIKVVDTTGAGDSIAGAFLYKLLSLDLDNIVEIDEESLKDCLYFANCYSNYSVCKNGAIASYATMKEIVDFIDKQKGR